MGLGKLAASAAAFKRVAEAATRSSSSESDRSTHRPLLGVDTNQNQSTSSRPSYGSTGHHGDTVQSPETYRRRAGSLANVPEESVPVVQVLPESDWQDYLEDKGLYIGMFPHFRTGS